MKALEAVLWDIDGTLAETERDGHRVAFNLAFEALGLPWRWDEARYGELLVVTGGRERLLAAALASLGGLVLAALSLWLESICRLPEDHDEAGSRSTGSGPDAASAAS